MNKSLAVYLFGYRLDAIAYPWRASLASALELAGPKGAVFFCACDDETAQAAEKLADPRLRLFRHPWADEYYQDPERVKAEGYKIQAVIGNVLLDAIGEEFDWALKLDADEVLAEWTFDLFREQLEMMWLTGAVLGRPRYLHFCPDDTHIFPFIYASKAVLSWTRASLRYTLNDGDDACALAGASEFQTDLLVAHYGKMHMGRRRAALEKEHDFQRLYVSRGFPDPKVEALWDGDGYMDYLRVFDVALGNNEFQDYKGRHPKFAESWLAEMRRRESDWLDGRE